MERISLGKRGVLVKDVSYDLIKKGLNMSSLRQRAISSNIANFNTPNYKVNRVVFEETLAKATKEIGLRKTHDKHYGIATLEDIQPKVEKRETTSLNDNGNNVDIDIEMTELTANEMYYWTLVRQISSKLSNLNYVINRT